MSYLRYLCLFTYSGDQHILCCGFFSVFLRLVYPMLSVSLDRQFGCPSVFSYVNFSHVTCVSYGVRFSGLSGWLPFCIL